MASYVVTGGSRGIGFEMIRQLSQVPDNVVVTIVRDKAGTDTKIAAEFPGRENLFVIQGDLTDVSSLKSAFIETKKITGDSLDVLIANAARLSKFSEFLSLTEMGQDPRAMEEDLNTLFQTNVIGNIHLFNLFLPLIKEGRTKKVVALSSALTQNKLAVEYEIFEVAPYSISKAALNMVVSKFQAQFKKEGIIFMGVCPGNVNTGKWDNLTQEELQRLMVMEGKFTKYAPHNPGLATPENSARDVLKVIENATMKTNGGQVVSHFGNEQWL